MSFGRIKKFAKLAMLIVAILGVAIAGDVQAVEMPETPKGYVSDFAGVLNEEWAKNVNVALDILSDDTGNEIAVVVVPDMGGDYIEHYSERLFRTWGIGDEEKDNGIMLLLAIEERKSRIEVGYGLEEKLTDSEADKILKNMEGLLRSGEYELAIGNALREIVAQISNEDSLGLYAPKEKRDDAKADNGKLWVLMLGAIAFQWLFAIMARTKSWWLGGVAGGVIGALISPVAPTPILKIAITIFFILIGLLLDYIVSKTANSSMAKGSTPPWWAGGGAFGRGSSGSFGGFGGGSSGGGGASGSW